MSMQNKGWMLPAITIGFLTCSYPCAVADEQVQSQAWVQFNHTDDTSRSSSRQFDHSSDPVGSQLPMPLDHDLRDKPWTRPYAQDEQGMWAYANDTGRVRTSVNTGVRDEPSLSSFGRTDLGWSGGFIRDGGNRTFTVNPSWLEVLASNPGDLELFDYASLQARKSGKVPLPSDPYASLSFEIYVTATNDVIGIPVPMFKHRAKVIGTGEKNTYKAGTSYEGASGFQLQKGPTFSWFMEPREDSSGFTKLVHPPTEDLKLELIKERVGCANLPLTSANVCTDKVVGARYDIPAFTEALNLDDGAKVAQDETYYIQYRLVVEGGEDANEGHHAEAFLGDPLDGTPGGLTLTTEDSPTALTQNFCSEQPDPNRFRLHNDGTATDRHTGLMWQRCPVGSAFDDAGTPNDPNDDACTDSGTADEFDWQGALTEGDTNSHAGHDDWQVPDVKALDSVVTACWFPSTDRGVFPAAPARQFWTSTPHRNGELAWQVDFADGEIAPSAKTDSAMVRLVRTATTPERPLPELRIGSATMPEGNSGATTLWFPVTVSSPLSTDITVEFSSLGLSATPGTDFESADGSIVIPAGTLGTEIGVQVLGDIEPEPDEMFAMRLSNASAGVWLARTAAIGTLENDEPFLSVLGAPLEGSQRSGDAEILFSLSSSTTEPVTVDYATADGSAIAGVDYLASSGSVTIAPGETFSSATITILDDAEHENDETILLNLTNASGAHVSLDPISIRIIDNDGHGTYAALNDTGADHCANAQTTLLTCPQADHPGQDGEIGRDVDFPDDSDGHAGFSFTKIDANGDALDVGANRWDCVQDEVTQLLWEKKDRNTTNLRDRNWTYTWFNGSGVNDGGHAGTENGGVCTDTVSCDTEKYIAAVNAANLCGYDDWRLPTPEELFSLAALAPSGGNISGGIDSLFFPNTHTGRGAAYWTATSHAEFGDQAWAVHFTSHHPVTLHDTKSASARIRLVRGGISLSLP